MVKRSSIAAGLGMLCTAFRQVPDEKLIDVWVRVLAQRFDEFGWTEACDRVLSTFQPTTAKPFPVPADFLAPIEQAAEAARMAEAGRAYDRMMRCKSYNANAGTRIDGRRVAVEVDAETLAAFEAAGGEDGATEALRDDRASGFHRNRFIEAYRQAAKARDGGAGLPQHKPAGPQLPPGKSEARRLMSIVDPDGRLG